MPVVEVASMGGGITNTKWLVRLADGDSLVLRWSDPAVWGGTGREHVRREALAVCCSPAQIFRYRGSSPPTLTERTPAARPNLMTWRPGRVRLDPLSPAAITALAQLAVAVHRQHVPAERKPPTYSFRGPSAADGPELGSVSGPVAAGD